MRPHERFFLAAVACVFFGVIGECVSVWMSVDRETFGPKGSGTELVRDVFGQGITPGLVAARLGQFVNGLLLLGLAMVLGAFGTVKFTIVSERRSASYQFEPDEDDEDEPDQPAPARPRTYSRRPR